MSKSRTIGKYRIIAQIGHGGMAEVFLAVNSESAAYFAKLVVIKKLKDDLARDGEFMTMLIDEARIAARLNHPNLVQTIEVGEAKGQHFLTMEYLDGQPLHRILHRAGTKFPRGMFMSILVDVLAGLHYAHELKDFDGSPLAIVHRDVTPQNIFVTYEGQVKVVDFGIAKAVGRSSETRHGVIKGKIAYMPPEQAGGMPIDRRADLYSIGVILFEGATGVRMWEGLSETEVITKLISGEIPASPKSVDPSIDDELDRICKKALAYVPHDRYATALELQRDLEAYLNETGQRVSAREIGDYVAQHFTDAREQMAQWIAEANARVDKSVHPAISNRPRAEGSVDPVDFSGAATRPAPGTEDIDSRAIARAVAQKKRRRMLSIGAAALLVAMAGGFALRKTSSAFGASDSSPKTVTVTLRATPLETRFSIDDGPPLENPYIGVFPEDGREHSVSATAPGYTSRQETLVFRRDKELSLRFMLAAVSPRTK